MAELLEYATAPEVARAAAKDAIDTLRAAIARHGAAVWVLAGGSSPMAAYRVIAEEMNDALDWGRVTVLIGDERLVPVSDPSSNWGSIAPVLFAGSRTARIQQVAPPIGPDPDETAAGYARAVSALPSGARGAPRVDLLWLGVGEDGHTLSLFPDHPGMAATESLVIAVRDSPKPPPTRITLTLHALRDVGRAVILAAGSGKRNAVRIARQTGTLPIGAVASHIESTGGAVVWLVDHAASS
ncbi:6-phosphogluconolactonase [Lysobacter korlensis]|uniref:6-phosphogluconolactonase n=1 Tax=Lysobacter korlensis TaxID=553636 RepID=A0ABV6RUC2_9GAMM